MPKLRHLKIENGIDFITTCAINRKKVFLNYNTADILFDTIIHCRTEGWCYLFGFAIMPDHLHIALSPRDKTVPQIMQSIKVFSSKHINEINKACGAIWQRGYRDFQIFKPETCIQKLRYIEANPVRAGLVDDPLKYPYSSAGRDELLDMDILF
jgi:putative transposase